jgi:type I restriction enzyme, S subunit
VSELPPGWVESALGEVAQVSSGAGFPLHLQGKKGGDLGFFKVGDISRAVLNHQGLLTDAQHYVSLATAKELRAKPVPAGATVFAKIGEAIKLNRRARVGAPCLIDNNVMAVKANLPESDLFLYWYLRTQLFGETSRSTTVPSLRKGDIESLRVPWPPLAEQLRISRKLELIVGQIDGCRRRLHQAPQILKKFREAVFEAAVSGKLTEEWRAHADVGITGLQLAREVAARHQASKKRGPPANGHNEIDEIREVPNSWGWVSGAAIVEPGADIVYGIVQPGPKLRDGVPYVRGMDIESGKILIDQLMKTSEAIAKRYERASLRGGDVLLGIIRATKVAIVPDELDGANITQGTARFRPSSAIRTSYLARVLEAPATQKWLHDCYRGIDMPGLNLADVRRVPIPLPSLKEQDEIVRRADDLLALAENLDHRCATAGACVERLTPSVLAKAFRGELVPRDPNDEPAGSMLERIRLARGNGAANSVVEGKRIKRTFRRRRMAEGRRRIRAEST